MAWMKHLAACSRPNKDRQQSPSRLGVQHFLHLLLTLVYCAFTLTTPSLAGGSTP